MPSGCALHATSRAAWRGLHHAACGLGRARVCAALWCDAMRCRSAPASRAGMCCRLAGSLRRPSSRPLHVCVCVCLCVCVRACVRLRVLASALTVALGECERVLRVCGFVHVRCRVRVHVRVCCACERLCVSTRARIHAHLPVKSMRALTYTSRYTYSTYLPARGGPSAAARVCFVCVFAAMQPPRCCKFDCCVAS
jgi:hypothetical protein